MHELSLAAEMVEQLAAVAAREKALRIVRIELLIGRYSGIERDAFEFAFPIAAAGGPLEGAELVVEVPPVTVECRACGTTTHPPAILLRCHTCGSPRVELKGGREFMVRSVELETP